MIGYKHIALLTVSIILFGFSIFSVTNKLDFKKDSISETIEVSALYPEEAKKPEMVAKLSDVIVVGHVEKIELSQIAKMAGGRKEDVIYTDTIIRVEKVLKAKTPLGKKVKSGESLTVRTLGGKVGNTDLISEIDPGLEKDEKLILFLVDSNQLPMLPPSPKPVFGIVWGYNGSFVVDSNGNATKKKTEDNFKVQDIIRDIEKAN